MTFSRFQSFNPFEQTFKSTLSALMDQQAFYREQFKEASDEIKKMLSLRMGEIEDKILALTKDSNNIKNLI